MAVWTDLETWPWLSRCASLAMPANDEGKLIAYKWRKSAFLETPEQIFCRGETHAAHLASPPHPYMGKIGQIDTASRKFFQHVSHHLMSKIELFGNLFRIFFQIAPHEYQQLSIIPANHASITSCQRLHIARYPSM